MRRHRKDAAAWPVMGHGLDRGHRHRSVTLSLPSHHPSPPPHPTSSRRRALPGVRVCARARRVASRRAASRRAASAAPSLLSCLLSLVSCLEDASNSLDLEEISGILRDLMSVAEEGRSKAQLRQLKKNNEAHLKTSLEMVRDAMESWNGYVLVHYHDLKTSLEMVRWRRRAEAKQAKHPSFSRLPTPQHALLTARAGARAGARDSARNGAGIHRRRHTHSTRERDRPAHAPRPALAHPPARARALAWLWLRRSVWGLERYGVRVWFEFGVGVWRSRLASATMTHDDTPDDTTDDTR